ncbi:MAG: hypothetical protein ACLQPH_07150 [Acidimicrobiales bacterium]
MVKLKQAEPGNTIELEIEVDPYRIALVVVQPAGVGLGDATAGVATAESAPTTATDITVASAATESRMTRITPKNILLPRENRQRGVDPIPSTN